jgi:hypothetical protein
MLHISSLKCGVPRIIVPPTRSPTYGAEIFTVFARHERTPLHATG